MVDSGALARIVAAVEARDGFALACLDDATPRAAWDACDEVRVLLDVLDALPHDWRWHEAYGTSADYSWPKYPGAATHTAAVRARVACPTAAELRTAVEARRATVARAPRRGLDICYIPLYTNRVEVGMPLKPTIRENRCRACVYAYAAVGAWLCVAAYARSWWTVFVPLAALGAAFLLVVLLCLYAACADNDPDIDEERP